MLIRQNRPEAVSPRPWPSHRGRRPLLAHRRRRVSGDYPRPSFHSGAIWAGTGTVTQIPSARGCPAIGSGDGTVTTDPFLQRTLDMVEETLKEHYLE